MSIDAIRTAVELAGGQTALAKAIHRTQGAVWQWLNDDDARPGEASCIAIEQATGVRCEILRPDLEWIRDEFGVVVTSYAKQRCQRGEAA